MTAKGKKIILIILSIIVVITIILLVFLYKAGVFANPDVTLSERGPFAYVYMANTGSYQKFFNAKEEIDKIISKQRIKTGTPCGVFLDDPGKVNQEDLRWQVGYLVQDSLVVEPPLRFGRIPAAQSVVASIKAHPAVAAFKTYPALTKWIEENKYRISGYAIELYNKDGVVEAMFPVEKK